MSRARVCQLGDWYTVDVHDQLLADTKLYSVLIIFCTYILRTHINKLNTLIENVARMIVSKYRPTTIVD